MTHRLHVAMGRGRRLAAFASDELLAADRRRLEAELLRCPACRREVEAYRLLSGTLHKSPRASLTPEEASVFWPRVEARLQLGSPGTIRPARPGLREMFWDHPRLSLVSAVAAVILVLGLTLGPMGLLSPSVVPNGVEVLSVEAGDDASVMVYQVPGSRLKVIWVFEKPSPS
jgi:anti-sigma factor RsiW